MRATRDDVADAIARLVGANRDVRTQFEENERLLLDSLRRLESGEAVESILRRLPTREERTANLDAVRTYYEERHALRKATIRAALAEGMAIDELATLYAVPHDVIAGCAATGLMPTDP